MLHIGWYLLESFQDQRLSFALVFDLYLLSSLISCHRLSSQKTSPMIAITTEKTPSLDLRECQKWYLCLNDSSHISPFILQRFYPNKITMTNKVNCVNILYQFVAEMLTFYVVIKSKKRGWECFLKPLDDTRLFRFYLKIGY